MLTTLYFHANKLLMIVFELRLQRNVLFHFVPIHFKSYQKSTVNSFEFVWVTFEWKQESVREKKNYEIIGSQMPFSSKRCQWFIGNETSLDSLSLSLSPYQCLSLSLRVCVCAGVTICNLIRFRYVKRPAMPIIRFFWFRFHIINFVCSLTRSSALELDVHYT